MKSPFWLIPCLQHPCLQHLHRWRSELAYQQRGIQGFNFIQSFGNYDAHVIQLLLKLRHANSMKMAVDQELSWLAEPYQIPDGPANQPIDDSIRKFTDLIHLEQHSKLLDGPGMTPSELARVCCNRWLLYALACSKFK